MEARGERRFMKPLIDHFGNAPLAKIDQAVIDRAARILYPAGAPATLNRHVYTPISAVLKHAAARGLGERRPMERPTQPKGRVRWLTPGEADRLIHSCADHLRPLVIFLFYTGARLSEALYVDWSQIEMARAHVVFLDTKNGEDPGYRLHPRVLAALASPQGRRRGRVPPPRRVPISAQRGRWRPDQDGLRGRMPSGNDQGFTPHDCRHTWATWEITANRDLIALMELGGWKSERMVLRYAHLNVAHLAPSINALPWGKCGEQGRIPAKMKGRSAD